ncbi:LuxR C-terminal-related transcriptional regulator [Pseudorhodoplanes sp.]|uniref:LuxR C-terminal-related transcriptional regulator n=1 Tax=Pseudorhodoplanes sp. TaxID=1934341 RepID=UPI00391A778E
MPSTSLGNGAAHFSEPPATAIVVIEQRILIRDCLVKCLKEIGIGPVLAFASISEWRDATTPYAPLLILYSLGTKEAENTELHQNLALLNASAPNVPVVVVSDSEDTSRVVSALKCGARGYIPTSVTLNVALEAMRLIEAGGTFAPASALLDALPPAERAPPRGDIDRKVLFTARQLAVLVALRRGKANKQIAYELNMREGTVKVHVRHIMKKLRARNRTEVAIMANDLLDGPEIAPS